MKFSIITVCYNNRAGLEKTIKSVIGQTFKDYEFIVIDGGSKDGTKELLEQYDDKIDFWCSEPDKGIYNAMNKGVTHAHGDYAIFMNSGDIFYNENILDTIASFNTDADIITGNVNRMDNDVPLRIYRKSIFQQLYLDTINHQGTFIKLTLLRKFPYDETLKIVSDWKFWIDSIIFDNANLYLTDTIVAKQDMTGVSQNGKVLNEEREKIINNYFPSLLQTELDNYYHLQKSPIVKNSEYIKFRTPFVYSLLRKATSCLYRIIKKINHE